MVRQKKQSILLARQVAVPSAQVATQMVQELAHLKDFSLSRIAQRCGVSSSTIHKIYHGTTSAPRSATFNRLLTLYHRVMFFPVLPVSEEEK